MTDAKINTDYVITHIGGTALKRRLLDMGFTQGTKIKVLRLAPLGGALLVNIRGVTVALRKNAMDCISVEVS